MIQYSKFSNDRAAAFRIRTDILTDEDGRRFVRKSAVGEAAKEHIRSLPGKEKALLSCFERTCFVPNRCREDEEGVRFEYLEGETVEMIFDRLLEQDPEELKKELLSYADRIRALAAQKFVPGPEFQEVFGSCFKGGNALSAPVSDIDLVPANLIPDGEKWHVIDYEWTFCFPVPVGFLIWRALFYYINGSSKRAFLRGTDLFLGAGISEDDEKMYREMEECFQRYVAGGSRPLWKLWEDMTPGFANVIDLLEETRTRRVTTPAKVYFDRGKGFSEQDTEILHAGTDGTVTVKVPLAGLRAFRIDPAEEPCVVKLLEENVPGLLFTGETSGCIFAENEIVFTDSDPRVIIRRFPKSCAEYICKIGLDATKKAVNDAVRTAFEKEQKKKRTAASKILRRIHL